MYTLPLNPIDLTEIYKQNLEDGSFVLPVDYVKSKKVLTSKQILIYLSNTGFTATFNKIDSDLVTNFIKLDFLVSSHTLTRTVGNIIRYRLGHGFAGDGEEVDTGHIKGIGSVLPVLFDAKDIEDYLKDNGDVIDDLVDDMSGIPSYIVDTINSNEESNISINDSMSFSEYEKSTTGLNILGITSDGLDSLALVIAKKGLNSRINTSLFNKSSKYKGGDLYQMFHKTGVVNFVLNLFPEDLITQNEATS
jgi:hypothetical protein